jgi:hypothetical protein
MIHQENIIPIKWTKWDEINITSFLFYDVIFTDDFGVFNKDEKVKSLVLDIIECTVTSINDLGESQEILKKQKFKTQAI